MTFKQICIVKNNKIVVTLPPNFENQKQVTVTIDDTVDGKMQKLALMKEASEDPLFLADIEAVQKDFDAIDSEEIWM